MNRDDYIPLSYIAQYGYCPRRSALLMLEQCWSENEYTAEGRLEHDRVHTTRIERRAEKVNLYEISLYSDKLCLFGKCDCLELTQDKSGPYIDLLKERYTIYPVEYKHGRLRNEKEYNMQLCAQAMCLEEMYGCTIQEGAIFYIDAHRRVSVSFTDALRNETKQAAEALWNILRTQNIPMACNGPKCKKCSLADICMPQVRQSAAVYIHKLKAEALKEDDG